MSPQSAPRDPELDVLRRDYDLLTRDLTASGPHPDEEMFVRLASGELSGDERARIADHVLSCAECSAVYRAVADVRQGASSFDPGAPRHVSGATVAIWQRPFWSQALAASLTIVAAGLLAWNVTLQQRTAKLQIELDRALNTPPVSPPTPSEVVPPPPAVQAHVNVPIVDLQPPSRVRGEGARQQVITLQATSALVTLIVNTESPRKAGDFTLDLLDGKGTAVWTGTGLTPQGDGTLSVALPTAFLRAGDYVFVLKEGGRTIHRYPVTITAR
jgi:putative zinc finger protein